MWQPKDFIAVLIACIAAGLLFTGRDTQVGWALIAVVAGYYGIDFLPFFKVGRNQGKKED